jgi:hypothetical protein
MVSARAVKDTAWALALWALGLCASPVPLRRSLLLAAQQSHKLKVSALFDVLALDEDFKKNYWQRKPLYVDSIHPNIAQGFTMEDVHEAVNKDFLEAGRGSVQQGKSGWKMEAVSQPKGRSFEDAKLKFEDIQIALQQTAGKIAHFCCYHKINL